MKSRRSFLIGAATSSLVAPVIAKASVGRFDGTPRVLTTLKIVNDSRSTIPAGAVTQLIGCPFKKGDVPSGSWPQFQLADGTSVPATILNTLATTWSDQSLKFVPVMLQIPIEVDAHVKVNVQVLSNGALPQGSARSLADFTAGGSPQVQVDGLDNLKGTWVMDLGKGIADGKKVVTYGNGPAGGVWKVRAQATQGSKRHHQLVCDFYVAAVSNLDGSLKGLRVLGKVKLPYYDSKDTMNWVSFSRFQLCADSSGRVIHDCFGKEFGTARAYQFSWAGGSAFNISHPYSTANAGDYGYCTRLSSTGRLPGGLSTNTSYFTGNPTATTIGFGTNSSVPSWYLVSATDAGSGIHTGTPYPYLAYFGALFTANRKGMWDFIQGAGSDVADTPLRCEIDKKYWVSTRLIPPYNVTVKPDSNPHARYWPNGAALAVRFIGQTGERPDIGVLPGWYVRHFLTQAAADEHVVRVSSLAGGQFSTGLEHSKYLAYPCVNNGPKGDGTGYRGMPAPNPGFCWHPSQRTQGFPYGDTTNPNVLVAAFSEQVSNHMPQFNYYPYLVTGEPWHLDMLLEHANNAVYLRYTEQGVADINVTAYELGGGERVLNVGSHPWTYGDTVGSHETRADAWASALLTAAAGICPDLHPDCKSYKAYFNDMNASTWRAALNIYKALPPYAAKYGLWHTPPDAGWEFMDHWQIAYLGASVALATSATEDKNAFMALSVLVRWFDHVVATFGGWHAGSYQTLVKSTDQAGAPIVTSDDGVAFYGPTLNWNAGGRFTVGLFSNYTPSNGDKFIFATTTPAGFQKFTSYYAVNMNGTQFDLSAQRGGSPLQPVDTYAGSDSFYFVAAQPPSTGSITPNGYPTAYESEVLGMLNYAIATGVAVKSATVSDLAYREEQAGQNPASDPKWAMTRKFM
jgi:hypothetical protein